MSEDITNSCLIVHLAYCPSELELHSRIIRETIPNTSINRSNLRRSCLEDLKNLSNSSNTNPSHIYSQATSDLLYNLPSVEFQHGLVES